MNPTKNELILIRRIIEYKSNIQRLESSGLNSNGIKMELQDNRKKLEQSENELKKLHQHMDTVNIESLELAIAEKKKRIMEAKNNGTLSDYTISTELGKNQMGLVTNQLQMELKTLEEQLVIKRKEKQ